MAALNFEKRMSNATRAWCQDCDWKVWGGLSHVHAKAHFEEHGAQHLVNIVDRDGPLPEGVKICRHCGIEVETFVLEGTGMGLWRAFGAKGLRGGQVDYCQPENLPGGVPDTRVFPLHGVA